MPDLKNIFSDRSSRFFRLRRFIPHFLSARRNQHARARVFHSTPRTKNILSARQKIAVVLTVMVIAAGIGLTYFSGSFNVQKVSVLRSSLDLPLAEIEQLVTEQAFGTNMFKLDLNQLKKDIKATRPDIARVEIEKKYPSTLQVAVYKYPIVAELHIGTERMFINENGYRVDGETPDRDTLTLALGESMQIDNPKQQIVRPDHLIAMRDAAFYFEALIDIPLLIVRYLPAAHEAHLIIEGNTSIWIDLTSDYHTQIDKLVQANNEIHLSKEKYQYVDLRVRNKIFYK